ncbi:MULTISPECIES: flagellar biosynthesis anti-sigma factor FlgM [unclassified Caballeronia]|uniref:flagellar biosynthesis anti-sigma factor FlgM n=1 Tax=unclassified Caballeronia TaxID=2646786 RepID=UPI00285B9FF7|nr:MULTISPECIES: flagellar biosynthesis anti-sigma factor FlgM [unclassified Caballeronia]MDR5772880.1 flagellar biosynthesis anti-sigma factor FlgM [Caballeronia sp. LZ002]MDR5848314.1 flagellar biosynthesis anti-sigma factor FlgM [Caballeronia sp. LZ003]
MKIESNSNIALAGIQDATQRASQNDAKSASSVAQAGTTAAQNSKVSLSSLSSGLRASNSADVDTAKVDSIKAALRDGSYKIDAGKIADGMLGSARDMLQTRTAPAGA